MGEREKQSLKETNRQEKYIEDEARHLAKEQGRKKAYLIKEESIEKDLAVKKEHQECKGIVLGHTHLPLQQRSPELLFLLNDGDMRHSSTFTIEDDVEFRHVTWDSDQRKWRVIPIPKP